MKRDAYGRLDANNYPLSHTLGPIEPETPWTIFLADDAGLFRYLCFDFDGKDHDGVVDHELMEQAADQCNALSHLLDELSIEHVVCQSSGTRGRHLWVAVHAGAEASLVARIAVLAHLLYAQLDFGMLKNPVTGSARPPLSPHRDGSRSSVLRGSLTSLIAPSTSSDDLLALATLLEARRPALRSQESAPSGPLSVRHLTHRPLSAAGAAHMATIRGGSNPSWTGFMCLLSAANAGWTLDDVAHAAKSAPGMEHYRTRRVDGQRGQTTRRRRSASDARAQLERQWLKAVEYASLERALPSDREPQDLTELEAIVSSVERLNDMFRISPGRWGLSESTSNHQTILRTVMYLVLHTGKPVVAAAIRGVGPMGGLGRTTASLALRSLAKAGFLERVAGTESGNAAEWRIARSFSTGTGPMRSQLQDNAPLPPRSPGQNAELFTRRTALVRDLELQLVDQRHDLFSRSGLGHLAGKLYALLGRHSSLTVDTSARLLGVTPRHTTKVLSRMRKHALIVAQGDGWARAKRDLRTRAAKILGVHGILVERVARYSLEREVWAWWQAELATMNASPGKRPRRFHVTSRPLYSSSARGERMWPRYPRGSDARADHRSAAELVAGGFLSPENRWQYLGDAA